MTSSSNAVLEILLKLRDEASDALGVFSGKTARNLAVMTAAGAAAGAGLEALAQGQQENTASARRLAEVTGMEERAVRDLAASLSTVDTPLEDVFKLMEAGTRQGVQGADALERYANFWDNVGDATGIATEVLTRGTVGLRAVGVATDNLASADAALGFVQTQTTAGLEGFFGLLERKGAALMEMNLNVDQSAALLGALEAKGLSGRAALTEFEQAVNTSGGSMEKMLATLGIAPEEFARQQTAVEGSSGALSRLAEANNSTFTPMQKLKHMMDEQIFAFGGLIEKAASLAPLLLAVGPAMTLVTGATKAWAVAQGLLNTALTANPIGLVIVAIGALVAAGVLLYQNWDTVKAAATALWQWISDVFERIKGAVQAAVDWVGQKLEPLFALVRRARDAIASIPGVGSALSAVGLPGFATGGIVPGPVGAPMLAVVHGGEEVRTRAQQRAGGTTISITVNAGVGDPVAIRQQVAEYVNRAVRAGGAQLVRGAVQA